jgi:DNA-nicking Smr family endonuclease
MGFRALYQHQRCSDKERSLGQSGQEIDRSRGSNYTASMANDKNKPKSLKDMLAPLKAQLKAEEEQASKANTQKSQAAKATAKPTSVPTKAAPPTNKAEPQTPRSEKEMTDAEMVEFWRAAAGTAAISESGRVVSEPKKKSTAQTNEPISATATPVDQETFASLLDLSDNTMKQALYEKEGAKMVPVRAISSKRVELTGLSPMQAKERLLRFLKAARLRKERVVLVVFGAQPGLREIVTETLDEASGELVLHYSDAGEPMAFKVNLV